MSKKIHFEKIVTLVDKTEVQAISQSPVITFSGSNKQQNIFIFIIRATLGTEAQ